VKAKLGIVLALPEPKIVVLGSLQVVVPSVEVPPPLRIVDLNIEIAAEFTPDYVWIGGSLINSKLGNVTVSGDMGLLIRWKWRRRVRPLRGRLFPEIHAAAGNGRHAPHHRRLFAADSSAEGARRGRISPSRRTPCSSAGRSRSRPISAVVEGKAWLGVDALFQWSPRFYFNS